MVHALTGGGAERVAVSWAQGLAELGHDVSILSDLTGQTYQPSDKVELIQRRIFSKNSNSILAKFGRKLFGPILSFFQIRSLIRKGKLDVIINVLYLNTYPLLFARLFSGNKILLIMTDHNAYERPKEVKMRWWQWKNKFIDNRFFDLVTVLTQRDKEILVNKGIRNVEVLHNPLFLEPIKTMPYKQKIVLACGRLDAWHCKGFDILVKAWKEIAYKYPDWKLRIVGHGSAQTKEFLYNIAGPDTRNFEIVPYTPNIQEEYQKASIFVLSSRYEGWGLVMVEAMSQGCATIACDYKGRQAEVIRDGVNGLLCTVDDTYALADKISLLIKNDYLRTKIQHKAIISTDEFKEENIANNITNIITQITIT